MHESGRESLYRPHQEALRGFHRIVPCTNLNIDILKGHVISPLRGQDPDELLSRNGAATPEPRHWETSILPDDNLPSQSHDPVLVSSGISTQQNLNLKVWLQTLSINEP